LKTFIFRRYYNIQHCLYCTVFKVLNLFSNFLTFHAKFYCAVIPSRLKWPVFNITSIQNKFRSKDEMLSKARKMYPAFDRSKRVSRNYTNSNFWTLCTIRHSIYKAFFPIICSLLTIVKGNCFCLCSIKIWRTEECISPYMVHFSTQEQSVDYLRKLPSLWYFFML
jgi:hypothetical protein